MIPLGLYGAARPVASGGLTISALSPSFSGSQTWDGVHWNRTLSGLGTTGTTRHIVSSFGHGVNQADPGSYFFAGYEFTLAAVSPTRAYASLWTVTLPPEAPTSGTLRYPDRTGLTFNFGIVSGPFTVADSSSAFSTSGTTVTAALESTSAGLVVAFGRSRTADQVASTNLANSIVGEEFKWEAVSGAPISVTTTITVSDFSAIAIANLAPA